MGAKEIKRYYDCVGKSGNAACADGGVEFGDVCEEPLEQANACLDCVHDQPVKCPSGDCCPANHTCLEIDRAPYCQSPDGGVPGQLNGVLPRLQ